MNYSEQKAYSLAIRWYACKDFEKFKGGYREALGVSCNLDPSNTWGVHSPTSNWGKPPTYRQMSEATGTTGTAPALWGFYPHRRGSNEGVCRMCVGLNKMIDVSSMVCVPSLLMCKKPLNAVLLPTTLASYSGLTKYDGYHSYYTTFWACHIERCSE
jgi:hypothetical protein